MHAQETVRTYTYARYPARWTLSKENCAPASLRQALLRIDLFAMFREMLLACDSQGAYLCKLRHRTKLGQERIRFHLWISAIVLRDGAAQLAEGEFRITTESVRSGKPVFYARVVVCHDYRARLLRSHVSIRR